MKTTAFILTFVISFAFTRLDAQVFPGRPKNASQLAGRIIGEQKNWQHRQLPKNSVQYKLQPPSSYTYTFNKTQKPFLFTVNRPGSVKYPDPFTVGNTKTSPYIKYYPSYRGKLIFHKTFEPGSSLR